jgi:hypothetical protein
MCAWGSRRAAYRGDSGMKRIPAHSMPGQMRPIPMIVRQDFAPESDLVPIPMQSKLNGGSQHTEKQPES